MFNNGNEQCFIHIPHISVNFQCCLERRKKWFIQTKHDWYESEIQDTNDGKLSLSNLACFPKTPTSSSPICKACWAMTIQITPASFFKNYLDVKF